MFFLIRPVGLTCQLKCGYCYYKDGHEKLKDMSKEKMEIDTAKRLIDGLCDIPGEHTVCLHGGEPLLIGKTWFADFVHIVQEHNREHSDRSPVSITVQTNAMSIDDEWIKLFQLGQIGVSVSLDGPAHIHDHARVTDGNKGTHSRVLSRIRLMADSGIRVGALSVITTKTLEISPNSFYGYFKDIPLSNGLDVSPYVETGTSPIELAASASLEPTPQALSAYLRELFDVWLFDTSVNCRVDIRMFEQLVGVALEFVPTVCNLTQGASCGRTPSLMPNGDIYACDLDVHGLDFRLGSIYENKIADICSTSNLSTLHRKIIAGLKSRGCTNCSLIAFCGLTCPRHSFSDRDHSGYCVMMEELVSHAKNRLCEISSSVTRQSIDFQDRITPVPFEAIA